MLTVLMATRNRAARLRETLDAMERLEAPEGGWRLVVVDDRSEDETPALLVERQARFPDRGIVVCRSRGEGLNAARNDALSLVAGDLVVFTDDDVIPRRDWLVRLRAAADAHKDVGIFAGTVIPRFVAPPPDWVLRAVRLGPALARIERAVDGFVDPTEAVGPSFAVRANRFATGLRFDATVGPDGRDDYAMGSETELLLRLKRAGERAWFASGAVVEHVLSASHVSPDGLVRRAYRYGRGRWRLGTARLARARVRVGGVPLALLCDLVARRLSHRVASLRGREETALRAAWRIAYLAGHVAEIRRARGLPATIGHYGSWIPSAVRRALPASATRGEARGRCVAVTLDPALVGSDGT